jgi:hypothetical protein
MPLVGGVATFATPILSAGVHAVTAEFAGDANFLGVTNRLNPDQVVNTPPVVRTDQVNRILPNAVKVLVSNLLTNDSDADGHGLTLASVAPQSVNGASVTRRSNWIYYVPPEGMTNADSFTYIATDGFGAAVAGTVNVRTASPQPTLDGSVSEEGGSYRIRFDGTPGVTYRIEFSDTQPATWQQVGTHAADEFGIVELTDTPPPQAPPRTYRSIAIY